MGNSAGASAVSYLCQSPVVKEDAFQQAIIRQAEDVKKYKYY